MTPTHSPNNSEENGFKSQFHLKELELDAILEITQAINNNVPEEALYTMYMFTLRANLNIEKLALYVWEEEKNDWECKVNFGTAKDFKQSKIDFSKITTLKEILNIQEEYNHIPRELQEFDLIIPVFHKDKVLAYIFVEKKSQDTDIQINTRFIQTLSNIIIVAVENKKLVRRQLKQQAFNKELEIAKKVQSLLFPKELPNNDFLQVEATYFPNYLIGGDYYDFIPISEDKFLFCIADVSGKGIPAALLMSNFQASLRTLIRQTDDLKSIVEELNHQIYENASGEHFITFFIALYDKANMHLRYINAGHNPALLFEEGKALILLDTGTTVLGAFSPLPFLKETQLNQLKKFLLFTYTDGITEIRNEKDEEYSLDRLLSFMQKQKNTDLSQIHQKLITEINQFKASRNYVDDVTLLSCRVKL